MKAHIFEEGKNPSSDYYIVPRLKLKGFEINRINIHSREYPDLEEESYVFLVRYASNRLIEFLKEKRKYIKKLIYFMDDGLWDLRSLLSVPMMYGWRLFKKAYLFRRKILSLGAEIWVSTEYLKDKYSDYKPKLVYPYPIGLDEVQFSKGSPRVVFYHGTSSHKQELEWLKEFFSKLSEKLPDVLLEVVVDEKHWKDFRKIKNLIAFRPMKWEGFYRFSQLNYRTVGLAPLFDSEFNRGRSWIKFYDITRSGAVGVFSIHATYSYYIQDFKAGYVLPMDINLWIEAIEELIRDEKKREELFGNAKVLVKYFRELCESVDVI